MREWGRGEGPRLLEILGLTGLVVTQPVLEVFQDGADVFVSRRAGPATIVAFALVVALVPGLVLWGVGALIGLAGERARTIAHVATLALLGGLLTVELVKAVTDLGPRALVPLAIAGGALTGLAVSRWGAFRLLLRYAAAGGVLFVGVFLFASPVWDLVRGGDVEAADVAIERPAPVVMIVLDELPTVSLLDGEGRVDEGRFPALAGLAADATWYRNHSTVAPITPSAVPALVSGELPESEDVAPVATAHPDTLFTLLGGTYEVHATENLTRLCPGNVCESAEAAPAPTVLRSLLGTARDVWQEVVSLQAEPTPVGFTTSELPIDPEAPDRLRQFGDSLAPSGAQPRFDYLHVLLPHQPYDFLPSGETYEAPDPPVGTEFLSVWSDQPAADVGRQRHLLQLQLTDRLVGDVLDRLRSLGTYDESLVVVTADHGVAFTADSPIRGVDEGNFPELMWTPLFVKAPGQRRAEVVDDPMQSIDVLGVIADELGADVPWAHGTPDDADPEERQLLDWRFHGIHPDEGEYLTFDGAEGFAAVLDHPPLGVPGDDPLGLYRIGPGADAIGGPLVDAPPVEATVETAGAYVAGRVEDPDPPTIALVVDGTIVATPEVVDGRFLAMVPDRYRPEGPDDVHVVRFTETP